ncbi:hypothetical protein A3762_08265 [Oleiphilus sp. HI0125]|nr:hypothetical protein A3762_08265 [Oleiphilus sp. HI0125]
MLLLIIQMVTTFLMTPIFIRSLGNHDYGVWELVGSIVGYMSILDLGLSPAIARYVAKHNADRNLDALQKVYSSSFVLLGVIGLVLGLSLITFGYFWPEYAAAEGDDNYKKYQILFLVIGLQLIYIFPGIVLVSVLEGTQLYNVKNNIVVINSIVALPVLYFLINEKNALLLLAISGFLFQLVKYVYYFWYVESRLGYRLLSRHNVSVPTLKTLLTFSFKSFIQGTSHRVSQYADNFIIAAFVGTAHIVFYSLANALLRQVSMLVANITSVFLPYFTDKFVKSDQQGLTDSYMSATKMTSGLIIFALCGISVLGDNFISLWVGPSYAEQSYLVLQVLVIYSFAYLFNPFDNRLVTALNVHGKFAKIAILESALNVVLSLVLVQVLGLVGVALGTLLAVIVGKTLKTMHCARVLDVGLVKFVFEPLLPNILPCLISLLLLLVLDSSVNSFIQLFVVVVVTSVIWFFITLFFALSATEKRYVIDLLLRKRIAD